MDKKINLQPTQTNPLILAFLGDSIFTQYVRWFLVVNFDCKINLLNKMASNIVCAKNQALLFEKIKNLLTENEFNICQRARNVKHNTIAKNATHEQYAKATQFEALLGYLFLSEDKQRLEYILNLSTEGLL